MSNLNLSPTFMSCTPSVQPAMTPFKGKLIGSPRCTELSNTVPFSSVPCSGPSPCQWPWGNGARAFPEHLVFEASDGGRGFTGSRSSGRGACGWWSDGGRRFSGSRSSGRNARGWWSGGVVVAEGLVESLQPTNGRPANRRRESPFIVWFDCVAGECLHSGDKINPAGECLSGLNLKCVTGGECAQARRAGDESAGVINRETCRRTHVMCWKHCCCH